MCSQVADCIGKGAYGTVWLAYLMDTNQSVVVKVVWPDEDLDPGEVETNGLPIRERMEAFQREIEMMEMAGRHPNVVTILGATKDSRVIVFEQAKIDLQALIKRERPGLTLPYISKWTYEILAAVEYLHARCKFVCVFLCVCVYVYVYMCIHKQTQAHADTHRHTHTDTHTQTHTHTHTHTLTHTGAVHRGVCVCVCVFVCTCMYTHTHTQTHTHRHTHTLSLSLSHTGA
jgi:serine/threonine protein kinase